LTIFTTSLRNRLQIFSNQSGTLACWILGWYLRVPAGPTFGRQGTFSIKVLRDIRKQDTGGADESVADIAYYKTLNNSGLF